MIYLSRGWPVIGEAKIHQISSSPITFQQMLQNFLQSLSTDKEKEDFVTLLLNELTNEQKILLYKMLYNTGCRINT